MNGTTGVLNMLADRVDLSLSGRKRVLDSIEAAQRFGSGRVDIWLEGGRRLAFSSGLHCPHCDVDYSAPLPNLFSFNSPIGACGTCRGFGRVIDIDLDLIIPDPSLSIAQGAVKPWGTTAEGRQGIQRSGRFLPTTADFHAQTLF